MNNERRTVSGGTGAVDEGRFDEPGYILQPPCLWGSPDFGFAERERGLAKFGDSNGVVVFFLFWLLQTLNRPIVAVSKPIFAN